MTTITFALTTPQGTPVTGGEVTFALSGFDLDNGIILSAPVRAAIGTDGTGTTELWPNYSGLKTTSYRVSVQPAGGAAVELGNIVVPASDTPVALHTLVPAGNLAGLRTRIMTQGEYDALEARDAQTLYLIQAEG